MPLLPEPPSPPAAELPSEPQLVPSYTSNPEETGRLRLGLILAGNLLFWGTLLAYPRLMRMIPLRYAALLLWGTLAVIVVAAVCIVWAWILILRTRSR